MVIQMKIYKLFVLAVALVGISFGGANASEPERAQTRTQVRTRPQAQKTQTQTQCSQEAGASGTCDGTPGQWNGCRGNGCAVCTELVSNYPCYFNNHPGCSPNYTCSGQYFTCNDRCPAPTEMDRTCNGSCNGRCGSQSGSCFCDSTCKQYGDCCSDIDLYCSK
jgi:hypothetical protein